MKKLLFPLLLMSITNVYANETLNKEVGELFLLEEAEINAQNQLSLGYAQVIDNNMISSKSLLVEYNQKKTINYSLGVSTKLNFVENSDDTNKLVKELNAQGIDSKINKPTFSLHGVAGLIPLNGKINYLNNSVFDFDISFKLGVGATFYDEKTTWDSKITPSFLGAIELNTHINKDDSINIGVNRIIDGSSSKESYGYTEFKITYGVGI